MKERAAIITESGIEILFIDFSGLSGDEFIAAIEQVKKFCLQLSPSKHYPSISDMTNASMNSRIRKALAIMEKEITSHHMGKNSDKIKMVIGISGLQKFVASAITQGITYVNTKQEAINYIERYIL